MHRTYSVANTMNAKWDWIKLGYERDFGKQLETFRNLSQLRRPQDRVVFLEEGKPSPDSFIVLYSKEKWVDKPVAPHLRGQNFGFADGHAEFWRWEDLRTLAWAKMNWSEDNLNLDSIPAEQQGNPDLQRLQIAAWGELGYTPSSPPRR
jgi:prepilin-type processing-associated H-X9-DG protein